MRAGVIFLLVWVNILGWVVFTVVHKPVIVEKEVEVIKEVPVEKIVYREGKEVIEKIVEKPVEKITYKQCSPEVVIACKRERQRECNRNQYSIVSTDQLYARGF